MPNIKKYLLIFIPIVLIAAIFGLGFWVGQITRPSIEEIEGLCQKTSGQPEEIDFSLFWDAWQVIQEKYVDRTELNLQEMVYGAIAGLLQSLDDPYSVFLPPQESKKFLEDMGGSFEGIGAEIGIRKGVLTIIAPLEGTPAQKAGIRAGDKVLKVDETSTADLTLDEAVNLIRGPKGTEVVLLISREEWDEVKEIKITRGTIKIPIFKQEMLASTTEEEQKAGLLKEDIAHIQFYHFTENAGWEFRKIAEQILDSGAKGLILDLRNNPGGYLEVAVDIASWFLEKGTLVAVEDFGNGEKTEYRSQGYKKLAHLPTVILINEGSASGSEILAGALRDHLGIPLVGQKSFGKGSVQQLEKLKGGSSIKITVAKWLTPSGVCIHEQGLEPDFAIELIQEDIDNNRDPQLDKALELLRTEINPES